jgi:hypothetical protein
MPQPVKLFLAGSKGPRTLQKYTVGAWDPSTTLRQLGASVMRPDAALTRAEASSKADVDATIWEDDALDESVEFCVQDTTS